MAGYNTIHFNSTIKTHKMNSSKIIYSMILVLLRITKISISIVNWQFFALRLMLSNVSRVANN